MSEPFTVQYGDISMHDHVMMVLHELAHARYDHPDDSWPWGGFNFVYQCAIMIEEAGEAIREANKIREGKSDDVDALYQELAQTAAMCLRCMANVREYGLRTNGQGGNSLPSE